MIENFQNFIFIFPGFFNAEIKFQGFLDVSHLEIGSYLYEKLNIMKTTMTCSTIIFFR